jgi:hypothetical protein
MAGFIPLGSNRLFIGDIASFHDSPKSTMDKLTILVDKMIPAGGKLKLKLHKSYHQMGSVSVPDWR